MRTRTIGALEVSAVGLGAMGFNHGYGPGATGDDAVDLMRRSHDLGCTFFDTAEAYGAGGNEELVGRALSSIRDQVVIATKFHHGESGIRYLTTPQDAQIASGSLQRTPASTGRGGLVPGARSSRC